MCGIVGYIGSKQVAPVLMDGLKRLEYRGYDSAGVAFLNNGQFTVTRAEGKLDNLAAKLREVPSTACIGIGHTRWATHGRPSEANAHPHQSRDVVLVHNGIIENYLVLKERLLARGFKFSSETDTEVVCHLIQDYLNGGADFATAFRRTLKELKGAFSFVVMHRESPDKLYAAKTASPLVVGFKDSQAFVASDVPALLNHTRDIFYLEEGEMAVLSCNGVAFTDFNGASIDKVPVHITWTSAQAEKGGYKHFMLKEIMEQPRALTDTLSGRLDRDLGAIRFDGADALLTKFATTTHGRIHIIACGTSWHAGLVGKHWIESLARVPVNVDLSSEFRYREPIIDGNSLVVAISQSGETADTLAALREAKARRAQILSVCNVIGSAIPRASDATIYTLAGPEIGVASTKAFMTQLCVLYLVALKLAGARKTLNAPALNERIQALAELPAMAEHYLKKLHSMDTLTEKIYKHQHCYFLGRGVQHAIVMEGALKLKEISYVHAEGYAGGEMKHGPIALIEEGTPVIAMVLKDALYDKMLSNIEEVSARGAKVIPVISVGDTALKAKYPDAIEVPTVHRDLEPFLAVLPLQLLAYHVAERKGTDVDQPRNLAKSVTVE